MGEHIETQRTSLIWTTMSKLGEHVETHLALQVWWSPKPGIQRSSSPDCELSAGCETPDGKEVSTRVSKSDITQYFTEFHIFIDPRVNLGTISQIFQASSILS